MVASAGPTGNMDVPKPQGPEKPEKGACQEFSERAILVIDHDRQAPEIGT